MDCNCPSKYNWILLKENIRGNLPQIRIWSLFDPENVQVPFLIQDNPLKTFAEYLLKTAKKESLVVDSYDQVVNLGEYNPNYMRIEQDFIANFMPHEKQSLEEKEINSMILLKIKIDKATYEECEYKLVNAYRYLKAKASANVIRNMSSYLWESYLQKLLSNITGAADKSAQQNSLKLSRIGIWKNRNDWKYNDIVALCKLGIPRDLRPAVWSELFRLSGARNPDFDRTKREKYFKYVSASMTKSSIVYKQIEEDIKNITATNYLRLKSFEYVEKPKILKVAKAYHAWCIEENEKMDSQEETAAVKSKVPMIDKENYFIYYRGILDLIQKVLEIFEEIEAFWCIVGFANGLPYLFKGQKTTKDNIAWNHKLILLAISTVMEVKYPDLCKAIIRHGLPIEYYISDKVFNLLSKVFPTDTLLRLYDIIALEAGSKEPIKAMWIIITGAIMLMTLNKVYIIAARNAEEVALIINNTGINKLNSQKLVDELLVLSNELFLSYNANWEKFLALTMIRKDSAIGLEQSWTDKAFELERYYGKVKELNKSVEEILKDIKSLGVSKHGMNDEVWMNDFVRRFGKYYGDFAKKEVANSIYIYVNKCYNLAPEEGQLKVDYASYSENMDIKQDGTVDGFREFAEQGETILQISVVGSEPRHCIINLAQYETDSPVTVDVSLTLSPGYENLAKPTRPQPYVSLVLLLATRGEEAMDDEYKHLKDCMLTKSIIIKPRKLENKPKEDDAMAKVKKDIKGKLQRAGLKSIYVPGMASASEENKDTKALRDNKYNALLHLFTLVKYDNQSFIMANMPDPGDEVKEISEKIYAAFTKHYDGRLPLKRVVVSLIASAQLTVDKKLSYFYDLYTSLTGSGENEDSSNYFLLDDIIELIQILCELHLIYIPPEYIPSLTEQIMAKGGISRITRCYLISSKAKAEEVIKEGNLKQVMDPNLAIDVTKIVQESFSDYWERWEHKQVFTNNSASPCASLNSVLANSSARPKGPGPYKLVVCYRHRGEGFYKVLEYDISGKLIASQKTGNEMNDLLLECRNNFSFVSERIKMTKVEFIRRIKQIPLLSELMRLRISVTTSTIENRPARLSVAVSKEGNKIATVNFTMEEAENSEQLVKGLTVVPCVLNATQVYRENLVAEVKEKVLDTINKALIEKDKNVTRLYKTPAELNSGYLNKEFQLFANGRALADYETVASFVSTSLPL